MRLRNYIGVILFLILIFYLSNAIIWIPNYFVPIAFWEYPKYIIGILIGTFSINSLVEYGILYDISKGQNVNKRTLLLSVILVNLVTFPPAQLVFYFSLAFPILFLVYFSVFIEIIVIVVESLLYRVESHILLQSEDTNNSLSLRNTLSISAVINIISFLVLLIIHNYLINAYYLSLY